MIDDEGRAMPVETRTSGKFDNVGDVVIIGAGAAGLIAALRAAETAGHVLVLERDRNPRGSTALSAGLIPAAGTRFQQAERLADTPEQFVRDILAKCEGAADRDAVEAVVGAVGPALEWLADKHGLPFSVIADFSYPGHSARRMHGLPSRSGAELMDRLRNVADTVDGVDILTGAKAQTLYVDVAGRVIGVGYVRPDGQREDVGCRALILACNGYGGNKDRVAQHIPQLAEALYFGHPGNLGDALAWGEALGADMRHLSGHQGHGSVAHPHGILITWATMTEGGFQMNLDGARFSDESAGYSEQAEIVLRQRDGIAWSIFDTRIAGIARQFEDFRAAETAGAVRTAADIAALASETGLKRAALETTLDAVARFKKDSRTDAFGRTWDGVAQLRPPFCAVKVTGALFHTQGGLVVDDHARVLRPNGTAIAGLFAAGGAACGISGPHASGYLSGNGLLTAVAYGYLAGAAAAK
jgi:fumarate reductase flavoprotein subunit